MACSTHLLFRLEWRCLQGTQPVDQAALCRPSPSGSAHRRVATTEDHQRNACVRRPQAVHATNAEHHLLQIAARHTERFVGEVSWVMPRPTPWHPAIDPENRWRRLPDKTRPWTKAGTRSSDTATSD